MPEVSEEPAFHLKVEVRQLTDVPALRTETGGKLCAPLEMHVCARWLQDGESNMAIIKVKLVSGFKADEESLDAVQCLLLVYGPHKIKLLLGDGRHSIKIYCTIETGKKKL